MSPPKTKIWTLDEHTKAKHEILKSYLGAWFPIMGSNDWLLYIDGFCGPGKYAGGEDGSPIIALKAARDHTERIKQVVFWFIDEDADRIEHLKTLLPEFESLSNFKIVAECGQFDTKFEELLDKVDKSGQSIAPTFAFIDPFGFAGIPFSLVKRLLSSRSCEVFINFMVEPINRWIEHPNDDVVKHIIDAFGTEDCKQVRDSDGDAISKLRDLYRRQLSTVASFVRPFEMRNKNDKRLYYLFFATNHRLGHIKMKEAMWKIDPHGEFKFSDSAQPRQLVIYGEDANTIPGLTLLLQETFLDKGSVTCEEIRVFVEDKTAFLKKHMTDAFKDCEKKGIIKVEPLKTNGQRRRASSYPDEATVTFLEVKN